MPIQHSPITLVKQLNSCTTVDALDCYSLKEVEFLKHSAQTIMFSVNVVFELAVGQKVKDKEFFEVVTKVKITKLIYLCQKTLK